MLVIKKNTIGTRVQLVLFINFTEHIYLKLTKNIINLTLSVNNNRF